MQPAQAEPAERNFQNPPLLEFREEAIAPLTLQAAPTTGGSKEFDLNIQYTNSKLYNPATETYDKVRLRSYVGTDTDPNQPYVAPVIEVEPGDTVRVNLNNQLPTDASCTKPPKDINNPHCFNGTNLHTHGLWISPTGNSDNVLLSINPDVKFQYEYNLPPDHPAGTFWYHPHRHGSTALQVSSGMAGALIVRGDRLPSVTANGDIDTLLKRPNGTEMPERILVLQQIQYYCSDPSNPWNCPPDDTGVIESYNNFGPGSWAQSGRYTSINGSILPTFSAKAGEIERWRLIHAGVRDTISLEFRKLKDDASLINALSVAEADRYIGENCTGDPIPYHVIADDGLTRAQAWETKLTTLQPGYRNDALVVFPELGQYCVIDTAAPAPGNVSREATSRQLLGTVAVQTGEEITPDSIHEYLTKQLILAARHNMPTSVKQKVVNDLNNDLKLTKFIPHLDIDSTEVTGKQELAFNIDVTSNPAKFEVSNSIGTGYDPLPYDPKRIDRNLTLSGVDEWILESRFVSHPFHIHVNPFQIVKILDPNGKDVSLPEATDGNDPQYVGLKGVWKDTLWIKGPTPPTQYPDGVYTIVARTRYQRYIGEFVLHCHILDHEDQGMMQNIDIVLPDGLA
ncbi:putative multicopper oxidase [Leptolyngbya sp. PCC 7375]|nr:putative multicopper oxidase [Leptolyngbya sp. PCC 7375]